MGPKKSTKESINDKENDAPSTTVAKTQEPQKPHENREKQLGKIEGHNAKPGRESKLKPLNKKIEAGKEPKTNEKWVLEGKNLYESVGNKVTLVKQESSIIEYAAMAMFIEDGAGASTAPVSGDHFWTASFGGTESGHKFLGITNSRWFKKHYGLFYSGILFKYNGFPQVEFGPVINSGDVIGILCSFSKKDLNIYFYHNGRCLGLSFQVPCSLFLPEGIRPCIRLNAEGAWATITKEPKEKIPKEVERIRAPAGQFGVEGIWRFKSLVDSKNGNEIPLNVSEKKLKTSDLTIKQSYGDPLNLFFQLWFTHYVGFVARKMKHNLWIKSESYHTGGDTEGPEEIYDHSLFPDFPIVQTISNPEKVDFQGQEMRVTKGGKTVIFYRYYKIRRGNLLKNESFG